MEDRHRRTLLHLLTEQRVAALAVQVGGRPFASLVPFAMTADFSAALIHVSRLARHSEGLSADAPFSLLIHETDASPAVNPAQLGRVTLQGAMRRFDRAEADYSAARDLYLARFPESRITFQLGDFTLCALQVETMRFVAGFAQTFDLTPADLEQPR